MPGLIERLGPREIAAASAIALIALAWVMCVIGAGFYAARLKRNPAWWGFLAFVVSPLPVFVLLFGLGPRQEEDYDHIACPFCAEEIKTEARICPHCRSDLVGAASERVRPR
jgi:uncharacterized membrane protein YGL010W